MKHLYLTGFSALAVLTGAARVWADEPIVPIIIIGEDGKPDPQVLKSMQNSAFKALRSGQYVDAAQELSICLELEPNNRAVKQALREAKQHVGTVKLRLNEKDVYITVDGFPLLFWAESRNIYVTPGRHKIVAAKPGFVPYPLTIDIDAGEERAFAFTLVREGQESYNGTLGIPPRIQMSFDTKVAPQSEGPTWPTTMMVGGFVGFGIGASLCVTGVLLMPENVSLWRGVSIGGGVLASQIGRAHV